MNSGKYVWKFEAQIKGVFKVNQFYGMPACPVGASLTGTLEKGVAHFPLAPHDSSGKSASKDSPPKNTNPSCTITSQTLNDWFPA